jgi:hypothetical protein
MFISGKIIICLCGYNCHILCSHTEVKAAYMLTTYDSKCNLQMVPAPELPRPTWQYMFRRGHPIVPLFNHVCH